METYFTKEHEWVSVSGDIATIGITDHAQHELGDIVYVDLPKVGSHVDKGRTFGSVDLAALGLTLDPAEVDKERGVVIEEWRGGLGAGSRVRDKQIPVLFYKSRYADRLPIGKPDVIRTAPVARLRELLRGEVARDGDEAHDLARGGDVEPGLARRAVRAPSEAGDDVAGRLAGVEADAGIDAEAAEVVVMESAAPVMGRGGRGADGRGGL